MKAYFWPENQTLKTMKISTTLLAGLAITSLAAGKTIPNYAEADLVLGQVDFISRLALDPPNAASLSSPCSVIVDPVTRKVFVAEEGNDRVLRYASADALANGAQAEAVFGQALFTTRTRGVTSNQFGDDPESIFLDARGRLWVPDWGGNRVLRFDFASMRDSSPSADRVYGQPNFTTGTSGTTKSKMNRPYDVCVDSADRLWVADYGSNRVLRFDNITTKPNGAEADGVLGQTDFITSSAGSGTAGLQFPTGVTISANGQLYVTCNSSNRVMRFDNAAGLGNGAPASAVLGQPDFATTSFGTTAAKMDGPLGAWITPDDSLWVADSGNNRVLRFNNASTKPNGAAADGVLGQPDFTSNMIATTRRGMSFPYYRPFADTTGSLWIAERNNNRVLRFSPDATPPLLAVTAPPKSTKKKVLTITGTASDQYGVSKVQYRIGKGPLKTATGTTAWSFKVKLKEGKNTITVIATDVDGIPSLSQIIKIKRK
jgi:streptogramin lyase